MNIKKSVLVLAAVGVMSLGSIAEAAGIGVVNMNALLSVYPEIGVAEMKIKKIESEYGPKVNAEIAKIEKMTDRKAQEDAYTKKVLPLEKKAQEEVNKIMDPIVDAIVAKVEQVRVQKKLDVVLSSPNALVTTDKSSTIEDITPEVAPLVKGGK